MAARTNVLVYGSSIFGIEGSHPTGIMEVCLLEVL